MSAPNGPLAGRRESIDSARPIAPEAFPNPPRDGSSCVPTTIPNVRYFLQWYGVQVRYNVVKKKLFIVLPGHSGTVDNASSVALNQLLSLAVLNGMSTGHLPGFVATIGDGNPWNPVADWIESKAWDGTDRLGALCATLTVREDFPDAFMRRILYRWLLSCVAAAFSPSGFQCRGVLTLQGPQGIGKTRWIASLVPDPQLRDDVVRLGQHLDARNKDDILSAVSHWIVEIGELDSSLRKDVAALKGFLSNSHDKLRRPYGRADSEYPRRTVFAATVNDAHFLVDPTGNSRFWTVPVVKIDFDHAIDMQQVFAQLLIDFRGGVQWWLTSDEQAAIDLFNLEHRAVTTIRELIDGALDLDRRDDPGLRPMPAIDLLRRLGYRTPTNAQCKECNAALRELLGEPKRIRGQNRWRVPLRNDYSPGVEFDDDE